MRWFLLRARARDGQIVYYTGKPFAIQTARGGFATRPASPEETECWKGRMKTLQDCSGPNNCRGQKKEPYTVVSVCCGRDQGFALFIWGRRRRVLQKSPNVPGKL